MALGTILLDIASVVEIAIVIRNAWREQTELIRFLQTYGLFIIFILSVTSIAGTLILQYADALAPCLLCWWQRVFMYPIGFISGIALFRGKKLSDIAEYVFALSFVGALIALYQHLLQVLPSGSLIPCDASGDCAVRTVFEFGFVTLPWMAFTAFLVIGLIALITFLGRKASSN